ncbi:MAG: addiction module protein [Deltaproteobacteria bacterium]|nr:addiction module protein [Deltaproteobacteria bacterium]
MTSAAKKILEDALALPDEERAALVDALSQSLELGEGELSPEWKAEIARRIEAVERGDSSVIPWEEVEGRVRALLGKA